MLLVDSTLPLNLEVSPAVPGASAPAAAQGGIVPSDTVRVVPPGTAPDYNRANPLLRLLDLAAQTQLAAERELYLDGSLQVLVPFSHLELYGPQGADSQVTDPRQQDNKTDFQKQNIASFIVTDATLARGWVSAGDWTGPFLKVSYSGDPDSALATAAGGPLGDHIQVWLRVAGTPLPAPVRVPYNEESDRYELELWGYPGNDLASRLGDRGRAALQRGELVCRPDLVQGSWADLQRDGLDDRDMRQVAPNHAMHPVRPLHVEVAWASADGQHWDSLGGANHQYEFNMVLRGWSSFLKVGVSANPHGGVGFLHYRNLLSNYFGFQGSGELGRPLEPFNFDAYGNKPPARDWEGFLSVDYMDLHILQPNCGVGIHRHRDNQEIFFLVEGDGLMVVGDWEQSPARERCFEIRSLRPGHFTLLKPGELHALMNVSSEPMSLLMFGGYD